MRTFKRSSEVPWARPRRKQLTASPANIESVLAIKMPHPGVGAIAAASFMATGVDDSGDAVYGHLQGTLVASVEYVGGCSIRGGKERLALALQAGEERKSLEGWCFDSGSSRNTSFNYENMADIRPCNKAVRVATERHLPIEGHGNLVVEFQYAQIFFFGTPEACRRYLRTKPKLPPVLKARLCQTRPHLPW